MPGTFEDSELLQNEQMRETTEGTWEKTSRAGRGKEKEIFQTIDVSNHPYYEQDAAEHPSLVVAHNLKELQSILRDEKEGPRWYDFLARALEYDKTLFEKYISMQNDQEKLAEAKKINRRYKQVNERLIAEKDDAEREALLAQEELSHRDIELETTTLAKERLQKDRDSLIRQFAETQETPRQQREDTVATSSTNYNPQNWRPRGINPSKPLKGEDSEEYSPWAYSVRNKLKTDAPLYADESEKVGYALSQMEAPIFGAMHSWVPDMGDSLSADALFEEIEHYMGIHLQSRDAKKELLTVTMKGGESVSEYYHRIFKLWQKAKTPVDERIEKFLVTLKPSISSSLMGSVFTDFRPLLDEARRIEDRRKDVAHHFPRPDKPAATKNSGQRSNFSGGQSSNQSSGGKSVSASTNQINSRKSDDRPNAKLTPTIVKPAGWVGTWYDPDPNPKKLKDDDRESLSRQRRCWACRGSGHRGHDTICPQYKDKNLSTMGTVETDSGTESDAGKV